MFIIPALTGGGAERVITSILKYINREKFEPILVLIKKVGPFIEDVPPDIQLIDLKCSSTKSSFLKIIRVIRTEKPHILMSTLGHLNLLIALLKPFLPKDIFYIARESNIISLHNKNEKYPLLFNFLFKSVYKNFDRIICQSISMKDDLVKEFRIPERIIEVINNPVDFDKIEKLKSANVQCSINSSKINFLAAGRLTEQKGFPRLLKAFSMTRNINNHLIIIGEGEEYYKLSKLVKKYNLDGRVEFVAFQKNPFTFMSQAHCLLMTSHYEGLPNVVLEANACGTPVIGFSTPGVVDVIEEGINGWLIENDNYIEFSKKIDEFGSLVYDKSLMIKSTYKKYNIELIMSRYENLFARGKKGF